MGNKTEIKKEKIAFATEKSFMKGQGQIKIMSKIKKEYSHERHEKDFMKGQKKRGLPR